MDFHDPYEEVRLRGRAVERRPDPDLKIMDPVSHQYIGKPFPMRGYEGRVALVIEVNKVRYTKLPFAHTPPSGQAERLRGVEVDNEIDLLRLLLTPRRPDNSGTAQAHRGTRS
ncbi:MAG: hypothetical protein ACREM3_08835 [Candidatus Rokuibacteriota bacterium]